MISLLAGVLPVILVAGAALFLHARQVLQREFDAALRAKAMALVSLVKRTVASVELDFAGEFMPEFEHRKRPEFFQIWRADGSCLERSVSLAGMDLPRRDAGGEPVAFWNLSLPDGRPGRAVQFRFVPQPDEEDDASQRQAAGELVTVVARERTGLERTVAGLAAGLIVVGMVVTAATALVITFAIRQGLAPLVQISEQVAGVDAQSLQTRFGGSDLPGELQPICQRLNELLSRLDAAFRRERQFSADIAHELRTPVAELRALAEVALRWPDSRGDAAFQEALAITHRMETLITGLLALARCESGKERLETEPIALAALTAEVWTAQADRARDRGLMVHTEVPADLSVQTDRALLRLIVANLLANAAEYAPAKTRVEVTGRRHDERFEFCVANTADDLTAEDVPRLFDRFWRKDSSRRTTGHYGLGLPLAQAAAAAIAMRLTANLSDGILSVTLAGQLAP